MFRNSDSEFDLTFHGLGHMAFRQKLQRRMKLLLDAYTCLPLLPAATIVIISTGELLLPLTIGNTATTTNY